MECIDNICLYSGCGAMLDGNYIKAPDGIGGYCNRACQRNALDEVMVSIREKDRSKAEKRVGPARK